MPNEHFIPKVIFEELSASKAEAGNYIEIVAMGGIVWFHRNCSDGAQCVHNRS